MVILLAHAKIEKFEDPEAPTYDRYSPRLNKHASALLSEWCDACCSPPQDHHAHEDGGFNRSRTLAAGQGKDGGERILRCIADRPAWPRNRYNLRRIAARLAALMAAIAGNMTTTSSNNGDEIHVSLGNFNANEVPPATAWDPIPAGKYLPRSSTRKRRRPSRAPPVLELNLQVLEGEIPGAAVWAELNLHNANAQTVKIARRAVGHLPAVA